ncbi:MAG: twin-arginine translocation pathway signal protein [Rhodoferax sp.]|nr:twin-arginine translocation pathway signal protein [Rhodoferax sp.]
MTSSLTQSTGTPLQRRQFIRIVGGGAVSRMAAATAATASVGLAACSPAMPGDAIEAWRGPDAAVASNPDVRLWLLSHAILAPHSHNLQSWVADLGTPNQITLYCDLKRLLPQTDPLSRQIMMSHGTFLELLDMAARERGLRAETTLFPQGAFGPTTLDARPVATVRLTPDATVQKDPLFAHILQRHTNRSRYDIGRAVPAEAWAAMSSAVNPAGAAPVRVGFAGLEHGAALAEHRRIAREAWRIELTVPRTILESYAVLRVGASEIAAHRDGLSLTSPMVVAMERLGLFDRTRAPAPDDYATTSQIQDFDATLASTPGFLWMVTSGNDRATQVNAGRDYVRVQLAATAYGLAMQPLSQALQEYAEQQQPYADIHALTGANTSGATVQMWARVGYAPAVEPAPRRRLKDFIRA